MMDIRTAIGRWQEADVKLGGASAQFVVGDVHGHGFELGELLTSMYEASDSNLRDAEVTYLGDLIDRGPCSLGAVRMASLSEQKFGFARQHMLIGNHEAMMLAAMGLVRGIDGVGMHHAHMMWMKNGGDAVLQEVSERLPSRFPCATQKDFRMLMLEAFGEHAFDFLLTGTTHRRVGNLLLCHAGVAPSATSLDAWFSTPLWPVADDEVDKHWAWVREPFYSHEGGFPEDVIVVHGHTPEISILSFKGIVREIKDRWGVPVAVNMADVAGQDGYRIGLDGGSFGTGLVMGAEFREGRFRHHFAWNPRMAALGRLSIY